MHQEISLNTEPVANSNQKQADPLSQSSSDPLTEPLAPPSNAADRTLPQPPLFASNSTSGPSFSPREDPRPTPSSYLGPLTDSVLENVDLGEDDKIEVDVGAAMAAAGTALTPTAATGNVEPSTRPAARVRISVSDPVKRVQVRIEFI